MVTDGDVPDDRRGGPELDCDVDDGGPVADCYMNRYSVFDDDDDDGRCAERCCH